MKILIIILCLFISAPVMAKSVIYNHSEIIEKKYLSEVDDKYHISKTILNQGKILKKSVLKYSTASYVECPGYIKNLVEDSIDTKYFEMPEFDQIIEVDYCDTIIYVLSIQLPLKEKYYANHCAAETITSENLIWIAESTKLTEPIYYTVSESRIFKDSMFRIFLESVSDYDNDDSHEIIINQKGYAGRRYIVLDNKNNYLKQKIIFGDSWD